jgi:hypothetical protein
MKSGTVTIFGILAALGAALTALGYQAEGASLLAVGVGGLGIGAQGTNSSSGNGEAKK